MNLTRMKVAHTHHVTIFQRMLEYIIAISLSPLPNTTLNKNDFEIYVRYRCFLIDKLCRIMNLYYLFGIFHSAFNMLGC